MEINGGLDINDSTLSKLKVNGRTKAKNLTVDHSVEVNGRLDMEGSSVGSLKTNGYFLAKNSSFKDNAKIVGTLDCKSCKIFKNIEISGFATIEQSQAKDVTVYAGPSVSNRLMYEDNKKDMHLVVLKDSKIDNLYIKNLKGWNWTSKKLALDSNKEPKNWKVVVELGDNTMIKGNVVFENIPDAEVIMSKRAKVLGKIIGAKETHK